PDTPDTPDIPDTPDKPDTTDHPALPGEVTDVVNPFIDVYESDWFYDDVMFAYGNGILIGTSEDMFSPFAKTTRAMIAVILWRMEGSPEPEEGRTSPTFRTTHGSPTPFRGLMRTTFSRATATEGSARSTR
ncbi:MAG: S-layer homology domain-containing protein, partial [Candidatus Flemingibacterium sp.]|nr:S-layer homology domain-containing protein [Candidatus Flemingibacterium sp.]